MIDQNDTDLFEKRRTSFDAVAALYQDTRPTYPEFIFDCFEQASGLTSGARILEIGAGTGIATRPLLQRGYRITAIEPGQSLADVLQSTSANPNLTVTVTRFEDFAASEKFDALFAAQSFHWIERTRAFPLCHEHLEQHGWLAQLWNFPEPIETDLQVKLDSAYAEISAQSYSKLTPIPALERLLPFVQAIEGSGLFNEPKMFHTHHSRNYTAESYIRLLGTHSDHNALPDSERTQLIAKIRGAIEQEGGAFEVRYLSGLILAQKA